MRNRATRSSSPGPLNTPSQGPKGAERRRSERVALSAEVGLRSESNFYTGFSDDISEGGLFVATYKLLPVGARLQVSFGLPSGEEIVAEAEVRWVRDPIAGEMSLSPGMGVRFTSIAAEQLAAIRTFMLVRPPMFYDED